eukprot:11648631-Alexandrium_andersonii.AAC.1
MRTRNVPRCLFSQTPLATGCRCLPVSPHWPWRTTSSTCSSSSANSGTANRSHGCVGRLTSTSRAGRPATAGTSILTVKGWSGSSNLVRALLGWGCGSAPGNSAHAGASVDGGHAASLRRPVSTCNPVDLESE